MDDRTDARARRRGAGGSATGAVVVGALVVAGVVAYALASPGPRPVQPRPPARVEPPRPAVAPPAVEDPAAVKAPAPAAPEVPRVEDPPGIWAEVERGQGHTASQDWPQASAKKIVGWFDSGKRVSVLMNVAEPLASARLYLHYNMAGDAPGAVDALIAGAGAGAPERRLGTLEQPPTGGWDRFAWTSIECGAIPAGEWTIALAGIAGRPCGGLDVLVLVEDRWDGLWEPPTTFRDGMPEGAGRTKPAVSWKLAPGAFRGVFEPLTPVRYDIGATNASSKECRAKLSWRILDYEGRQVDARSREFVVPPRGAKAEKVELASAPGRGWYAVAFDDGSGAPGTRYFACMEPVQQKDRTASRFGMNGHGLDQTDEDHALAARLGVGWMRGLSLWHLVQGGSSREQEWRDRAYTWDAPDTAIALSAKHGIRHMGSLGFSVAWASSSDPAHASWWGQSFYPPDDLTPDGPYATYVKKLVERYRDRVMYWEHWNEPDIHFWKGTPEQYVQTLACAHAAARSVDPRAQVLNGGYANIGLGNIQKMLAARIADHQELVGIHGYNNSFIKIWPLKRIYKRAGAGSMKVWNTETGREPSMDEGRSFDQKMPWMRGQAEEVARTFIKNFASDVERVFWFCWAWEPYGIFTVNGPRPSAMAYRALSDLIDTPAPAKLLGTLDLGRDAKGVFAFVFGRADGAAVVIWREDAPPPTERGAGTTEVAIPLDTGARATAYGIDGRDLKVQPKAGLFTVPARVEPTLVKIAGSVHGLMSKLGWTERYPGPVKGSIEFTDGAPVSNGIYAEAFTTTKELAGRRCAATDKQNATSDGDRFYIRVDLADDLLWETCDTFGVPKKKLALRLTYFDRGRTPLAAQVAEGHVGLTRTGTNEWRTATLDLTDTGFPNQSCHCDMRLTSWAWGGNDDIEIHKIEVVTGE